MSMFTLRGTVVNTFYQQGKVNKETGEIGEGSNRVQIMGEIPVVGGGKKVDLITLSIPDGLDFKKHLQKAVEVPLGFFSPQKGQIIYFIPKGSQIASDSL